ncbi:tyrosine-type recombinase/integrase [Lelliottia nimipressuralis]|uniref:Site-specific integrase n=1 Tax=Lelliottia nimipressuralis TaxID=69220 RepID=A0ABD4K4T0_9ENTR|nr:site-specific integrase [Lelliottia nimipressuralis]MBF4176470.1 site-specific integrase [Lelliottia nimipressuralis]
MKLAELLPDYMKFALIHKKSYFSDFSKINKYILPRLGEFDIHEMNKRDIAAYLQSLDGLRSSTKNRHLALLKAVLTWGVEYGYLDSSPAAGMKAFREPASLRRAMEPSQFSAFMQVLDDDIKQEPRDTLLILAFLALTGVRLGEARSADIKNINMSKKTLFLNDTKSGDSRLVPLCQKAMDIVLLQMSRYGNAGLLFRSGAGGRVSEPRRLMTAICERAGIERFTIHELRYTAGSAMLAATRDVYAVKRFLGHKCISTTTLYAQYFGIQQHDDVERAMALMLNR